MGLFCDLGDNQPVEFMRAALHRCCTKSKIRINLSIGASCRKMVVENQVYPLSEALSSVVHVARSPPAAAMVFDEQVSKPQGMARPR